MPKNAFVRKKRRVFTRRFIIVVIQTAIQMRRMGRRCRRREPLVR